MRLIIVIGLLLISCSEQQPVEFALTDSCNSTTPLGEMATECSLDTGVANEIQPMKEWKPAAKRISTH